MDFRESLHRLGRLGSGLGLILIVALGVLPNTRAWIGKVRNAVVFTNYNVSGKVTDNNGVALSDTTITFTPSSGPAFPIVTGPDGTYSVAGGLDGSKSYTLTPSRGGYTFVPVNRQIGPFSQDQVNLDFVGTPLTLFTVS